MTWPRGLYFLLRLALGGVFIYASFNKILHPAAFAEVVYNYQVLPGALINLTAIVMPWLELFLGLLLIFGKFMPGAAALTGLLLAVFWASLLFNLARGLDVDCGCFSIQSAGSGSMAWYLFRDSVFLIMGLVLFILVLKRDKISSSKEVA